MRFLVIFLLFFSTVFANNQAAKIKENERIQAQLNKKLEDLATDIKNSEKNLKQIATQINSASSESANLEKNVKFYKQELINLNAQNESLKREQMAIQTNFASLMTQDFAYDLALPDGYVESFDSFMAVEILDALDQIFKSEFDKIAQDYKKNSALIDEKQGKINEMNSNLKKYNTQLTRLESLKTKQMEEIDKQKTDRAIYAKKLEDIQKQQDELRKTLAELNIVSKNTAKKQATPSTAVKQVGSSYHGSLVKRYSGKKTIAPLENFTIKQKFGNFTDPIYNIKMFNENVILRAKNPDARVKAIFDGKIVYAKQTNLLQNVVIVEHSNGIHTIYAHLYQIAPTAKVGKKVKKGEIIGRVKNDLTFEVTQEKFHINPLEIISLN